MRKPNEIYILVACEESQAIANEFRKRGFNAFSCDLEPCSGGHPEYHFRRDCFTIINSCKWDLVIAHPLARIYPLLVLAGGITRLDPTNHNYKKKQSNSSCGSRRSSANVRIMSRLKTPSGLCPGYIESQTKSFNHIGSVILRESLLAGGSSTFPCSKRTRWLMKVNRSIGEMARSDNRSGIAMLGIFHRKNLRKRVQRHSPAWLAPSRNNGETSY